mmetsp:Transcript_32435/g.74954  ORF Transcript_32435/g.74954 Transcript_32435/m.74954 type:complete len:227 (+) Transcript_32435:51-731(+)
MLVLIVAFAAHLGCRKIDGLHMENFALLYFPGMVGNYASIPFMSYLSEKKKPRKKPIQKRRESWIVGNFNWMVMIPVASWVTAPLLPRHSSHWVYEVVKAAVHLLLSEVWFYTVHWCCHHSRFLYKHVHSHHHRITDPDVENASYQHPLEMFLITMGTIWVGPLIVPSHAATITWQGLLIAVAGNYGHCGLTSIHDDHHRCPKGRYGFCYFTDMMLRTYHFEGHGH